jgi:hypothetical protein
MSQFGGNTMVALILPHLEVVSCQKHQQLEDCRDRSFQGRDCSIHRRLSDTDVSKVRS